MEFIQNLLMTIILGIWAVGSVVLVVAFIQNVINDHKREKRQEEQAERDKEYHFKRMSDKR